MNIIISSALLSLSIILLADSIYKLRPHKRKKRRKAKKEQPVPRVNRSVIDLHMTDLRNAKN